MRSATARTPRATSRSPSLSSRETLSATRSGAPTVSSATNFAAPSPTCNNALALSPQDSGALNNRGRINLRLKQYAAAIADFTAALDHEPGLVPSLYGRGLAKRATGDMSADADIAAAISADPDIAAKFAKSGDHSS